MLILWNLKKKGYCLHNRQQTNFIKTQNRWSNLNLRLIFEVTALLHLSDLGLASTIFIPKCPSESVKPVNQLLQPIGEVSIILSPILKLYFSLINLTKSFNLWFLGVRNLPWIRLIKKKILPFISPKL